MDSYITDERNGLNYKLVENITSKASNKVLPQAGSYYLPMIKAPETPKIGIWGRKHLRYLKENRKAYYTALLISGKLFDQAVEIDRAAEELYDCLTKEIALREGVTEDLKARDQLAWTGEMNNIAARAREIVENELIKI